MSNFAPSMMVLMALAVIHVPAIAQAQVLELFEADDSELATAEEDSEADGEETPPDEEREDGEEQEEEDETDSSIIIDTDDGTRDDSASPTRTIRIQYEKQGQSILVPARVGRHEAYFIFDTGASYTTLTSDFARTAGVFPDNDAPQTMVQTAGGMQSTSFGLISRFRMERQNLDNISFTLCDACGGSMYDGKPVAGLLGLNVLRRYRVSVDDSRGLIELEPHSDFDDRAADIEPWIQTQLVGADSRALSMQVQNQSSQQVTGVVVEFSCTTADGAELIERARTISVRARGTAEVSIDNQMASCRGLNARVVEARW